MTEPVGLSTNPVNQTGAFSALPTTRVTLAAMALETLGYWATVRLAFLSGYTVTWAVPMRSGNGSTTTSVLDLNPDVVPVPELFPARTARFTIEPYVVTEGFPHIEPAYGISMDITSGIGAHTIPSLPTPVVPALAHGRVLGETARWIPNLATYSTGTWNPWDAVTGVDGAVRWQGSVGTLPNVDANFTYSGYYPDSATPSMQVGAFGNLRLLGLSSTIRTMTLIVVASVIESSMYWLDLLAAIAPDGSSSIGTNQISLRLMPDGMLFMWSTGWQGSLPLTSNHHRPVVFGLSLDPDGIGVRMFTMGKEFQLIRGKLLSPHLTTTTWTLGVAGQDAQPMDVLDVVLYRNVLTDAEIAWAADQLAVRYGLTAPDMQAN